MQEARPTAMPLGKIATIIESVDHLRVQMTQEHVVCPVPLDLTPPNILRANEALRCVGMDAKEAVRSTRHSSFGPLQDQPVDAIAANVEPCFAVIFHPQAAGTDLWLHILQELLRSRRPIYCVRWNRFYAEQADMNRIGGHRGWLNERRRFEPHTDRIP